MTKAGSSLK